MPAPAINISSTQRMSGLGFRLFGLAGSAADLLLGLLPEALQTLLGLLLICVDLLLSTEIVALGFSLLVSDES